jgi:hypothetical protein
MRISLIENIGQQNGSKDWSLFIDFSKLISKDLLLHNGVKYDSVCIAQAVHVNES